METNGSNHWWLTIRECLVVILRWFNAILWTFILVAFSGVASFCWVFFFADGTPPRSLQDFLPLWFALYWLAMFGVVAYTWWKDRSLDRDRESRWIGHTTFVVLPFLLWCARDGVSEGILGLLLSGAMFWALYRAQAIQEEIAVLCRSDRPRHMA